jgi:hypothetical protein
VWLLQAVALQLAGDVIRLRSQLEDAQVELGVEKLARQVQQQLAAAPAAAQQQQQQEGEAASCRMSAAEGLEMCQASVLQALQERKDENEVRSSVHRMQLVIQQS